MVIITRVIIRVVYDVFFENNYMFAKITTNRKYARVKFKKDFLLRGRYGHGGKTDARFVVKGYPGHRHDTAGSDGFFPHREQGSLREKKNKESLPE